MTAFLNPASLIALAWSTFQIWMAWGTPMNLIVAVPVHVMFAIALTFVTQPLVRDSIGRPGFGRTLDYLCVALAVSIAAYFLMHEGRLTTRIASVDPLLTSDYVVGVLVMLLVIEAVRRALGMGLTVVILVFLVYQFSGPYLRGIPLLETIAHRGQPTMRFAEYFFDMQILQNEGVFGIPSVVSYTQVFYFLLFGAFLERFGGGKLFIDLSILLVGRFRGGMAKVSIISSTLFGAVSGSATANAAVMGTLTIPAMKRAGMRGEEAAAVEASSSTGGQLMPPVMGAAAFLIAQFMGIPYRDVAIAGLLPALLFYVALYFVIDAMSRKRGYRGLQPGEIEVTWTDVFKRLYLFAPVVWLVWQIMAGRALSSATLEAVIITIALAVLTNAVVAWREQGLTAVPLAVWSVFPESVRALENGGRAAVAVAIPCAGAGIVVGIASMTNLGLAFGGFVSLLSGGMLIPALLIIMIMVLVMGMGMPTTAAYIMGAILAIPALDMLNVNLLSAHFFVLYFAALSMVTPPVALAAFVTGGIAKANVWKTGLYAFRFSLAGFIVAFALVLSPALLMVGEWERIVLATITAVIGCYVLAACVAGYLRRDNTLIENVLLFVSACLLIAPVMQASLSGLILFAAVWLWQGRQLSTTTITS